MKKYLTFIATSALLTFWVGVVTSSSNLLPFALEEVMTFSFLAVILFGYIFIELELTPDFTRTNSSPNNNGTYKKPKSGKKPVFANQLIEKRKLNHSVYITRFTETVKSIFHSLVHLNSTLKKFKKILFHQRQSITDAEKKISDMFAN